MRRQFFQRNFPVVTVAAPAVVDCWRRCHQGRTPRTVLNSGRELDAIRESRIASSFRQWISGHDLIIRGISACPLILSHASCERGVSARISRKVGPALKLQISDRTLQEWEQARAVPHGFARAAVEKAIRA